MPATSADKRGHDDSVAPASERVRIEAGDQPRLGERQAADAVLVRPIEPIGPARIATGREGVVETAAVADRYFRPRIEIGAPLHGDHRGGAVRVVNDGARRLDHGAGCRAIYDRLILLRGRLNGSRQG